MFMTFVFQNLTDLLRINLGFNQLTKVPQFSSSTKVVLKTLVLRNNSLDNIEGRVEFFYYTTFHRLGT